MEYNIGSNKISEIIKTNIFTSSIKVEYLVANTGCGKTTYLANLDMKKVITVPTINALRDIKKAYPGVSVYYGEEKDLSNPDFIITTHSSLSTLSELIDTKQYTVIFDEAHNLVASASISFRNSEYREFVDTLNRWGKVILTSATPLALNHENLTNINYITIKSDVRKQDYKLVQAVDEVSYILDNISGKSIIFLNSKNEQGQLGILNQALLTKYKPEEILIYNAARKENGEEMIETNMVPDNVKVIITTSVFLESFNLNTNIDNLFVLSTIHPVLLHQLANRTRKKAVGMVHIFQNNQKAYNMNLFDIKMKAALSGLKVHVETLIGYGCTPDEINQELREASYYVGQKGYFSFCPIRYQIVVNHFAIDNHKFQEEALMYAADNSLMEKILQGFNWELKGIINYTKTKTTQEDKAFRMAAKAQAGTDINKILTTFDKVKETQYLETYLPDTVIEKAILSKIVYLLQRGLDYTYARKIMQNIGVSDTKFAKVKEALKIQMEIKELESNPNRNSMVSRFLKRFKIGDTFTPAEAAIKVKGFMLSEGFLKDRMDITERNVMDIIKKHYEIFRTKEARDGKFVDIYKIKSTTPLNNFITK